MTPTTDALVLRTSPYSESTLIVWLLTPRDGVARVLAKGARGLKGRTVAAFDSFALVRARARLASDDRLGSLSSAELARDWPFLRTDLKRFALASFALETLGDAAAASPPEPFFFDEAVGYLDRLAETRSPGSLTAALLLRLLHHGGSPPRLDEALEGKPLPERVVYDFGEGTFADAALPPTRAHGGDEEPPRIARRMNVPRDMVERLLPALRRPPRADGEGFAFPASEGAPLLTWLARVWEDELRRPLRSFEFLERTVLRPPK